MSGRLRYCCCFDVCVCACKLPPLLDATTSQLPALNPIQMNLLLCFFTLLSSDSWLMSGAAGLSSVILLLRFDFPLNLLGWYYFCSHSQFFSFFAFRRYSFFFFQTISQHTSSRWNRLMIYIAFFGWAGSNKFKQAELLLSVHAYWELLHTYTDTIAKIKTRCRLQWAISRVKTEPSSLSHTFGTLQLCSALCA